MKSLQLTIAALASAAIAITASQATVQAQNNIQSATQSANKATSTLVAQNKQNVIGAQEVDQSSFILSTNPTSNFGGRQRYGLMIIEQKSDAQPCYSTTGSGPTQVNPLLSGFDFSGICGRATDTNGYAIRAAGEQIRYNPVFEQEDGVLVLYAEPSPFLRNAEKFVIGQTDGIAANGYTQVFLKPGWRLTRKTVDGSPKGLMYLTNDSTVAQITGQEVVIEPGGGDQSGGNPSNGGGVDAPSSNFNDIARDIYRNEINRAVQLGFIAGKTATTFGPSDSLTREQIVSIVVEGLGVAPADGTAVSSQFRDVPSTRWSAAKIQKAQQLNIVTGDGNGSFRPTDNVTRAELIAIMRRAAEYKNSTTTLAANQPVDSFADISGHWAEDIVTDLSGYCGIASPLNETGNSFYPQQAAKRNYAAAAMVRLLDCSQTETEQ